MSGHSGDLQIYQPKEQFILLLCDSQMYRIGKVLARPSREENPGDERLYNLRLLEGH